MARLLFVKNASINYFNIQKWIPSQFKYIFIDGIHLNSPGNNNYNPLIYSAATFPASNPSKLFSSTDFNP